MCIIREFWLKLEQKFRREHDLGTGIREICVFEIQTLKSKL